MNFPDKIKKIIGDRQYFLDTVGMSGAQVIYFDDYVLKVEKRSEEVERERQMMLWLSGKLPVPQVICYEIENEMSYLLMSRLHGEMSCSSEMLENPKRLVTILAEGLNMLWGTDLSFCPYYNYLDDKLKLAEIRVTQNLCRIEDAEPETFGEKGFKDPAELLQWLKENKPVEELVFSHGDYCLPNVFVKDNKINGFIDLGRSGIADKYQDIALCYRSLKHNFDGVYGGKVYGEFDPTILFDILGIVPDMDKIRYYIWLDELF